MHNVTNYLLNVFLNKWYQLMVAFIPSLGKPGKLIVYRGPLIVAPGSKALYVTRHMYTCAVHLGLHTLSLFSH